MAFLTSSSILWLTLKPEDFGPASEFNDTSRYFVVLESSSSVASTFSANIPKVRAVFPSLSAKSGSAPLANKIFIASVEFVLEAVTRELIPSLSCA